MTHPGAAAEVVLLLAGVEVARWTIPPACVDLALVDGLARLQLAARRAGCAMELRRPSVVLTGLLELAGLAGVIASAVEVGREAEEGKQVGVEEVVVPDDPVA